jgi:predicted nucleotidyltransferase
LSSKATNTIKLSDELEARIRDALAPLHPEKVILFGSYACGRPAEDSDIDLYVVTQDASEIRRNRQQLRPPGIWGQQTQFSDGNTYGVPGLPPGIPSGIGK